MKNKHIDQKHAIFLLLLFGAYLIKAGFFYFKYTPVLDDYIQYGVYPLFSHPFRQVYLAGHLYAARPLAGLMDIYVWSRFWNAMCIPYAFITLLYFLSALQFQKALSRAGVHAGGLFLIIYLFFPLNIEAVYWLSASVRIVPSLFLFASSMLLLASKKKWSFALSFLLFLLGTLLYEQTAIIGAVLYLFCAYKTNRKFLPIPILSGAICMLWYLFFILQGQMQRVLPAQPTEKAMDISVHILNVYGPVLAKLLTSGFLRGTFLVLGADLVLFLFILLLCAAVGFFLSTPPKDNRLFVKTYETHVYLLAGVLFVFSYAFMIFLKDAYPALRNAMGGVIAIALVADSLLKNKPTRYKSVGAFCLFVFIFVNISELSYYQKVHEDDMIICEALSQSANLQSASLPYQVTNVTPCIGQHILNISSSDWALTGAMRAYTKNPYLPMIDLKRE